MGSSPSEVGNEVLQGRHVGLPPFPLVMAIGMTDISSLVKEAQDSVMRGIPAFQSVSGEDVIILDSDEEE